MTESSSKTQTTRHDPAGDSADVDKDFLYGRYIDAEERKANNSEDHLKQRQRLSMRAAHKALDIPEEMEEDEMRINNPSTVTNTTTGMGWKELLIIAGLAGSGILGTFLGLTWQQKETSLPVQESSIDTKTGVGIQYEGDLRFTEPK